MTPDIILIPTYTVISRHSADCPHKNEKADEKDHRGRYHLKCGCRKHIAVYDPRIPDPKKRQSLIPTKTRDGQEAERIAQAYRDRHDPDKVARAKAEAELEALKNKDRAESTVATIEEAIAKFLVYEHANPRRKTSRRSGKAADSTVSGYGTILGHVVIEHGSPVIKRHGRLTAWVNTLNPRPMYISDLTESLVDDFRASWNAPIPGVKRSKPLSDITAAITFTRLKTFFNYCRDRGKWISKNPLDGVPLPTWEEGYRTAPFTETQYDSIISTIKNHYPAGNPEALSPEDKKQYNDTHRLLAFIELMRWSGLALADAVQFELSSIKDNGAITVRRIKTNNTAEPTLLPRVVTMLREVVPIDADFNRPFYDKDIKPESNRGRWSRWAKEIFEEAGIQTIETEIRDREPHCHMLRDTFVVNQIRTQKELGIVDLDSIAKAIGDSEATLRKHYAPWVKELQDAHRKAQQRIVEAQAQKEAAKEEQGSKVVNIAGGRK